MVKTIVFFSGEGSKGNPEIVLQNKTNLMLTFHDMYERGKPTERFQKVLKARRKQRGRKQ